MKYGAYFLIEKSHREQFISDIKNSPQLPERFYVIYETMYPDSLSPDTWMHFFNHGADSNGQTYCACREAFYVGLYPLYVSSIDAMLITNYIEQNVSQRECLNYYVKKSAWWFKPSPLLNVNTLTDTEIIELFLRFENSSFYNKDRFPDRVQSKVNEILNKLNN